MTNLTTVVRAFASEKTHVVTVPETLAYPDAWPSDEYPFTALPLPLDTRCGVTLRGYRPAIMMQPGTRVNCVQCRRLSGVEVQTEEIYTPIHTPRAVSS